MVILTLLQLTLKDLKLIRINLQLLMAAYFWNTTLILPYLVSSLENRSDIYRFELAVLFLDFWKFRKFSFYFEWRCCNSIFRIILFSLRSFYRIGTFSIIFKQNAYSCFLNKFVISPWRYLPMQNVPKASDFVSFFSFIGTVLVPFIIMTKGGLFEFWNSFLMNLKYYCYLAK